MSIGSSVLLFAAVGLLLVRWSSNVATKLPLWLDRDWRHQAESFLEFAAPSPAPDYRWWTPRRAPGALSLGLPILGPMANKNWAVALQEAVFVACVAALPACMPLQNAAAGVVLVSILLCGAAVDARTQLLPDCLTLPLLWFGLVKAWYLGGLELAVTGAVAGFMALWLLQQGYYLLRKEEGMGGGDVKLAGALGAWLGFLSVPPLLLTASLMGIAYALYRRIRSGDSGVFAFGPCLALAGIAVYATSCLR
jgi:Flp pilus assembly protein protease CpaA